MEIMEAIGITMTTRERNSVMGETRAAKTTPDNDVESVTIFLFLWPRVSCLLFFLWPRVSCLLLLEAFHAR